MASAESREHDPDDYEPTIVTAAFELADTHFRAISSLQEIIVKVSGDGRSSYIRGKMERLGWTTSAKVWDISDWVSTDLDSSDWSSSDDED